MQGAYDYAYAMGITTQSSIENANMYGTLIRSHMAKMMVNYAKEVIWLTADTSKYCWFSDISSQTIELQWYIQEACQMGLMGVGLSEFMPNGIVNRAQFGTVLSRILFWDTYDWSDPYYADHLAALQDAGIMNYINTPNAPEKRWLVMLMMQRADKEDTMNTAVCDTPENVLACSLDLDTCPNECLTEYQSMFSWWVKWPNDVYKVYIYGNNRARRSAELDSETYRFTSNHDWIQIFYFRHSTYDDTTLDDAIDDMITQNRTSFSYYKLLSSDTEYINGNKLWVIRAKINTGGTIWADVIYTDWDIFFDLYITYDEDDATSKNIADQIIDSIEIEKTNQNCNPDTEHQDGSLCISNTKDCSINDWEWTQERNWRTRWTCEIDSCDDWFAMQYGSCVSDTQSCYIYHGTWEKKLVDWIWWSCNVISCIAWYSINNNACYVTQTRSCTIDNGVWTQNWANNVYGICTVVSCNNGYVQNGNSCTLYVPTCTSEQHLSGSVCVSNTMSCSILNWIGQQTWVGGLWWTCSVSSCNNWYVQNWNACTILPTCGGTQHLESSFCVDNFRSCTIANWVWQELWNGSSWGSCIVVSCGSWYVNLGNNTCTVPNPFNI